jgi:6-phosphogluconolactonase
LFTFLGLLATREGHFQKWPSGHRASLESFGVHSHRWRKRRRKEHHRQMARSIIVCDNPSEVARRGAEIVVESSREAIAARGRFTIALSGGSTPEAMFRLLAGPEFAGQIDWPNVWAFLGDERYVPADDPRSNFGMASRTLLTHLAPEPGHVFPIDTHIVPIQASAKAYENLLTQNIGTPPVFDLMLQGMGDDGHTASLFPHAATLDSGARWVVDSPPGIPPPPVSRITVTLPVINAARRVLFLATGEEKATVLKKVLESSVDFHDFPSAGVTVKEGELIWLIDKGAASELSETTRDS